MNRYRLTAAAAALTLMGGATAALPATAATKKACPKNLTIGFLGALSGENGALGQNMVDGASIAFEEWNKANKNCQVAFTGTAKTKGFDSQGNPDQALPLASTLVRNKNIVGLIGPGFSGETRRTMPTFQAATLPVITPGATNATLTTEGWTYFHRILANDDKQGPGIVKLIKSRKFTKVGVIDDASEYGKGLADTVRKELGTLLVSSDTIDPKGSDFSAAVNKMNAAGVDAVFYGGYYAEAAKLVKQLRDAKSTAVFVAGDGVLDPSFVKDAGDTFAEGVLLTATGAPADINPVFQGKFKAKFGKDPALYSPEAYDCAQVFLAAIKAGKYDRKSIGAFIDTYNAPGVTKQIKFTVEGEVAGDAVYTYEVKAGKIVSLGLAK